MLPDVTLSVLVLAFHQGGGGGGGSTPLLLVVLGAIGTLVWLLFSSLAWRTTVLAAAGSWAVGLALLFVL